MFLVLLACVDSPGVSPQAPARPQPPSVLLVTLDTTRADRLGPYGYALADTPTLDRLADEGVVFENATSSCPLTIPSHASIFTGRFPPSHGVRDNGDFVLGPDQVTLAERFAEAGYWTAAFTSAFPTQRRWGFGQGFELYWDPLERLPTQLDWRDQRRAGEVIDDALAMLDQAGDRPAFVWVHLFDAHWPYEPPEPWASQHDGRPYDGEIAYADAQVGRLLEAWDERFPRSVVLVTADHGEAFGDGGERTHGFLLHDGTLHVPLVLRGEGVPVGQREGEVVGHPDIAPTLLQLAGLPAHEGLQGRSLLVGGSDQVYSEALTGRYSLGLSGLHSVTDQAGRYTEGAYGAWYPRRLFGIATVPEAEAELLPHASRLSQLVAQLEEVSAPNAALDEQALAQLQALGYLGGELKADGGGPDPRDVIGLVPLTWEARQLMGMGQYERAQQAVDQLDQGMPGTWGVDLLKAQLLRSRGELAEARELFADLYLRSPSSTVALQLGGLAAARGDYRDADAWFSEALELQPASPEALAGRVRAARALGEDARARELAEQVLLAYPDHAEVRLVLAEIHLLDLRYEAAQAEALAATRRMPGSPWAQSTLAQALWELGEADEAISALQEALALDRFNLPVRVRLTECLLEVGRAAEAHRTIQPVHELFPEDPALAELAARAQRALAAELAR